MGAGGGAGALLPSDTGGGGGASVVSIPFSLIQNHSYLLPKSRFDDIVEKRIEARDPPPSSGGAVWDLTLINISLS